MDTDYILEKEIDEDSIDLEQLDEQVQQEEEDETNGYIKMDYSLDTSAARNEKVKEIIANLESTDPDKLTPRYLDRLAEYIVEPITKEERKQKNILTKNRMVTVNKRETSYEGLVGKLENGEDGLYNMIINDKNVIFSPKVKITQEDIQNIPGLRTLVEAIEQTEREVQLASGKKKFLLKKQVIEMRQDQYALKKIFDQPIYSRSTIKSLARLDLTEHISLDPAGDVHSDCCINFFEPDHIVALLCNYTALKLETWNKFSSDMKWMLIDFENLVNKTLKEKYPLYYDLVCYKIAEKQNIEIQQLLYKKYGIKHTVEYISALWRNKIPKLICEQAKEDWLIYHFTQEERGKWKRCSRCGQIKLAHNRFFSKNNTSKDGFYSICKECRNKASKKK